MHVHGSLKELSIKLWKLLWTHSHGQAIISPSVCRILAHGWVNIQWNGERGVGNGILSEEGLEAPNKFRMFIRSRRSRTNSTIVGLILNLIFQNFWFSFLIKTYNFWLFWGQLNVCAVSWGVALQMGAYVGDRLINSWHIRVQGAAKPRAGSGESGSDSWAQVFFFPVDLRRLPVEDPVQWVVCQGEAHFPGVNCFLSFFVILSRPT